jgi:hypothetical protein
MLDINASAKGVFVFIANPQCYFIDSPKRPALGPTTHTILAAEGCRPRSPLEAGINMKPLFDFATNRIETERAKLTELTPAEEARRRWESVGPGRATECDSGF